MKQFETVEAAKNFLQNLNIPNEEIENVQTLPHLFTPLEVRLKWADCDIIRISQDWIGVNKKQPEEPPYKKVYTVEKRYFMAPALLSEVLGMTPKRYQTPEF